MITNSVAWNNPHLLSRSFCGLEVWGGMTRFSAQSLTGWNQGVCRVVFPSGAWSPLTSSCGYWQKSVPCGSTIEIPPLSCWSSARGQPLEATCYFLPYGVSATWQFAPSRSTGEHVPQLWISLTSCHWPVDFFLISSGPPTFTGKALYIYTVCTPGSRNLGAIVPAIGRLVGLQVSTGGEK